MSNGGSTALRERQRARRPAWPEELERFFERTARGFGRWPWPRLWRPQRWLAGPVEWLPDIDVLEREGKIVVRADLPGLKRDDVEVAVEEDTLVIRGRREEEAEIKEEDYYCCERAVGEFSRAITLPQGAGLDAIEATYEDGVLEVTVPLSRAPERKTIKVPVK